MRGGLSFGKTNGVLMNLYVFFPPPYLPYLAPKRLDWQTCGCTLVRGCLDS